ncbi:MAG: XdhC family protein [Anaerolineae bacterium]
MQYDVVVVDPDRKGEPDAGGVPVVTALADIGRYALPDSYVVVASHGNYDEAALEQVVKARPRYIGLVASRKRFEAVLDYLRSQGIDETELARIKAPAGLDIQALRGDEIAVSILAEIIRCAAILHQPRTRRKRPLRLSISTSMITPGIITPGTITSGTTTHARA